MTTLCWSDALALDHPLMDETHQEFVELLAQVERADNAALLPAWQALISHTEAHFGQEDAWMVATGFSPENCHSLQHRAVLRTMREALQPGRDAEAQQRLIRDIAQALAPWFVQHAQSMDAGLALHLRSVGYDPESGQIGTPSQLPRAPFTGCGSSSCGDPRAAADAANAAHTAA